MDKNEEKKKQIEKTDKVGGLKKNLYSQEWVRSQKKAPGIHKKHYEIKEGWEEGNALEKEINEAMSVPIKNKTMLNKILLSSIIFFVFALVVVAFTIFGGISNVSTSNVDISVVGPASIKSGDKLDLQITVTNNNAVDLELADLIVEYPEGTRLPDDLEKQVKTLREALDNVPSGRSIRKEFSTIVYGEENSEKDITISLEYRIAGSNAIFFIDRSYEMIISSSPINLVISPMKESISGQEIEFSVSIVSNAEQSVSDLILVGEYPFGFEFIESDPKPKFSDNVWDVDENDVVRIKGIMKGQEEEEKVFKFRSGTPSATDERKVGAIFALAEKTFNIEKPFIGVDVVVNGERSNEYVFGGDDAVRVDVVYRNNSANSIIDVEIEAKLVGEVLSKNEVNVDKGFYRSGDDTIFWDKRTQGELYEISPGDSGQLSFSFLPAEFSTRSNYINPEVDLSINIKGNRLNENNTPEEIESTISRKIKVSSDLLVTPRATYYTGPFTNTGSLPPKVDQETTYTITWSLVNSMNDLANARVISSLPSYVRWMGVVSPNSELITYNPVGGEIVWEVGSVKAGTGIKSSAREISFQVALLPSLSQVGVPPVLVNKMVATGVDRFANVVVTGKAEAVNTRLDTDPGYSYEKSLVTE